MSLVSKIPKSLKEGRALLFIIVLGGLSFSPAFLHRDISGGLTLLHEEQAATTYIPTYIHTRYLGK